MEESTQTTPESIPEGGVFASSCWVPFAAGEAGKIVLVSSALRIALVGGETQTRLFLDGHPIDIKAGVFDVARAIEAMREERDAQRRRDRLADLSSLAAKLRAQLDGTPVDIDNDKFDTIVLPGDEAVATGPAPAPGPA